MQNEIVVQNKIAISPEWEIVCGNSDYEIVFLFDDEWAQHDVKTAIFEYNGGYVEKVFTGNICPVPVIKNTMVVSVGVYAGDIRTTTKALIKCRKSALCGVGNKHQDPEPDVYAQLLAILENGGGGGGKTARIGFVTLLASAWTGDDNLFAQVVDIEGVTENSQVDLTPDVQQLAVFYEKDLTFVTENEDGTVTVYAIGQKPANDYTIQVTITEVEV